jgi:intraflagellar transport protein 22
MHLKVVFAGPKGVGKSDAANFISGQSDKLIVKDRYEPTSGVRILEFDMTLRGVSDDINIELWDCSGDHQYESCWKAIMHESDGVVLMYNPDVAGQDQQLGDWFDYFVRRNGLKDEQSMVFAHRTGDSSEKFRPRK